MKKLRYAIQKKYKKIIIIIIIFIPQVVKIPGVKN